MNQKSSSKPNTSNWARIYWCGFLGCECSRHGCKEMAEYVCEYDCPNRFARNSNVEVRATRYCCQKHAIVFAQRKGLQLPPPQTDPSPTIIIEGQYLTPEEYREVWEKARGADIDVRQYILGMMISEGT